MTDQSIGTSLLSGTATLMEKKLGINPIPSFGFSSSLGPSLAGPSMAPCGVMLHHADHHAMTDHHDDTYMDYETDFAGFCPDSWTNNDDPSSNPLVDDGVDNLPEECITGLQVQTDTSLRGRLRSRLTEWKSIGCDKEVLDWLTHGYPLPFMEGVTPEVWHCPKNHPGAYKHSDWLRGAIAELLTVHAVKEWTGPGKPTIVSPLNVVPKATKGKYRLILDLRPLNKYLTQTKFRMETLARSRWAFQPNDWLIAADLRSGYYHVDILPEHYQYLGFEIEGKYYVFCCLPFGLSTAPYVFTRVTRQVVRYWRRQGIRLIHYLDDWLWMAPSRYRAQLLSSRVVHDLTRLGFLLNYPKSTLSPVQSLIHLGFLIDTTTMTFAVPPERQERLMAVASELVEQARTPGDGYVVARLASKVAGHILSFFLALGPVTRMRSRYLYRDISPASSKQLSWDARVPLSTEALADVEFFMTQLSNLPPSPIHPPPLLPAHVLYTDAGEEGWGANLYLNSGYFPPQHLPLEDPVPTWGALPPHMISKSSTLRELFAIGQALAVFGPQLQNCQILIRTDSASATFIWANCGSQKVNEDGDLLLHEAVLRIDSLLKQWNIIPQWEWVPRDFNSIADFWSKFKDPGDYRLDPFFFQTLDLRWGPHTVDRMACAENALLPRFYSRYASLGTEGIDCFSVLDWSSENNFVHPDFNMIARVIEHMQRCEATGTIIVPEWPSQLWWPWLFPEPDGTPSPVLERILVPPSAIRPAHSHTVLGKGTPRYRIWALRISFATREYATSCS